MVPLPEVLRRDVIKTERALIENCRENDVFIFSQFFRQRVKRLAVLHGAQRLIVFSVGKHLRVFFLQPQLFSLAIQLRQIVFLSGDAWLHLLYFAWFLQLHVNIGHTPCLAHDSVLRNIDLGPENMLDGPQHHLPLSVADAGLFVASDGLPVENRFLEHRIEDAFPARLGTVVGCHTDRANAAVGVDENVAHISGVFAGTSGAHSVATWAVYRAA
mmetsp:Transcript_36928/g.101635  ORF Transcript_36928/g.101635 Transcript_36928/m.101635 type:complete len:215 (+) Transcript_36928:634-1278(+)